MQGCYKQRHTSFQDLGPIASINPALVTSRDMIAHLHLIRSSLCSGKFIELLVDTK